MGLKRGVKLMPSYKKHVHIELNFSFSHINKNKKFIFELLFKKISIMVLKNTKKTIHNKLNS